MTNTIKIEKFNGKNSFNLWRIKMRALLKEQRVWGPLATTSVKKERKTELSDKSTSIKKEDHAEQEEKAHSLILLSLSDEVLYEVADQETACGLWLKLEKLYMTKDIDVKIEDEDSAMILLASLPPSYVSFVNSLSVGKDFITLEEVKASLHLRDLRHKASASTEEPNGIGLVTNPSKNSKKKIGLVVTNPSKNSKKKKKTRERKSQRVIT
uniref:Retrovirus-related Pol polyprotein from transposon TNT 1-94 n=1 Tax=Cajanus cajan TaxID=3821 RepID=A0A151S720_CAJCA|nr:Retrovirus-related Pol polyprotein from transposon TNT 1-94 [Cajanus cajan]